MIVCHKSAFFVAILTVVQSNSFHQFSSFRNVESAIFSSFSQIFAGKNFFLEEFVSKFLSEFE